MREFVADIGNTRIKWGECGLTGLIETGTYPFTVLDSWAGMDCHSEELCNWTLAGTNPSIRDRMADLLRRQGDIVHFLDDYRKLPIGVQVDFPEKVGFDRLLNRMIIIDSKLIEASIKKPATCDRATKAAMQPRIAAHCFLCCIAKMSGYFPQTGSAIQLHHPMI